MSTHSFKAEVEEHITERVSVVQTTEVRVMGELRKTGVPFEIYH